jgi:hypothetical protein
MALLQKGYARVEPQPEAEFRVQSDWRRMQPPWAEKTNEPTYTAGDGARRAVREYGADLERLADS